jgi:uncharacterized protein YyaL (SSP411 family)
MLAKGGDYAGAEEVSPHLRAMDAAHGDATTYLCSKGACQQPLTDAAELAARLSAADRLCMADMEGESSPDMI